jgi:hypothetical protein
MKYLIIILYFSFKVKKRNIEEEEKFYPIFIMWSWVCSVLLWSINIDFIEYNE